MASMPHRGFEGLIHQAGFSNKVNGFDGAQFGVEWILQTGKRRIPSETAYV
jgi:hypothetical protein